MAIEETRQGRHSLTRFGQVGILPEEVPHALEDIEIRLDPRIAQLSVQQDRLAEAQVARAGKQESGRVAFRNVVPLPETRAPAAYAITSSAGPIPAGRPFRVRIH